MDFFAQQARTLRMSRVYTALFMLTALLIALCAGWLGYGLYLLFLADSPEAKAYSGAAFWLSALLTLGGIAACSFFRLRELRLGGGARLAESMGAEEVARDNPEHRVLINVVEEMAVAAGIPVPRTFVLSEESGINALAAGYDFTDAAVIFSRGALNKLDRDQLQAVAGHELSHILGGDMRQNMLLLGMLHGIMALGGAGREMLAIVAKDSEKRTPSMNIVPVAGALLWALGSVGLLLGRVFQMAASRQREYRADAFSVQFTRNPVGLTGALRQIAVSPSGSELDSSSAESVAHMCVAEAIPQYFSFFAAHPPIRKRILAIDPTFDISLLQKSPENFPLMASSTALPEDEQSHGNLPHVGVPLLAAAMAAGAEAPSLRCGLPPDLQTTARNPWAVQALLPALIIADSPDFHPAMLQRVEEALGAETRDLCAALVEQCAQLPAALTLPLADMAFPALRGLEEARCAALVELLPELARMSGRMSLFGYCLSKMLARRLELAQQDGPARSKKLAASELNEAVHRLFAVFAMFGAKTEVEAARAFRQGLEKVLLRRGEYRRPQNWTADLDYALRLLPRLNHRSRLKIMRGLMATVRADSRITVQEEHLLRLMLACFNLPSSQEL